MRLRFSGLCSFLPLTGRLQRVRKLRVLFEDGFKLSGVEISDFRRGVGLKKH